MQQVRELDSIHFMVSLIGVEKKPSWVVDTYVASCATTTIESFYGGRFLFSSDFSMGDAEKENAYDFLVENGILYSKLHNQTNDTFLAASSYGNEVEAVSNPNYNNRRMYWTRSHDGCIENLRTGKFIHSETR